MHFFKRNKQAFYASILLFLGFAIAACSSGGGGSSSNPPASGGGGQVVIMPPPTGSTAPDLDVSIHIVSDDTLTPGQSFTFRVEVDNFLDTSTSPSTTLRYYRSNNSIITRSDTEVGTDFVRSLSNGEASSESITLTAPSTEGTYYYGACVDEVAGEDDPSDDCSSTSEAVRVVVASSGNPPSGSPDLDVRTHSVSDNRLTLGQSFTFRVDVYNFGGTSPSTTLRYYRSGNSTISRFDTEVGIDSVRSLSNRETSSESITLAAPSTLGIYYYGACVDEVAGEADASNDCSATFEARRVVVSSSSNPPGDGSGSVEFTLEDACDDGIDIQVAFHAYDGDSLLGQLPRDGQVIITPGLNQSFRQTVNCRTDEGDPVERVCFGANRRDGGASSRFWGVGIDGDQSCADGACCVRCTAGQDGTSPFRSLTCPSG